MESVFQKTRFRVSEKCRQAVMVNPAMPSHVGSMHPSHNIIEITLYHSGLAFPNYNSYVIIRH